MAHAFTAVMNGRDLCGILNIPRDLVERKVLITIDPVEKTTPPAAALMQKLFANAPNIKVSNDVRIDHLMDEMNDALS